MIFGGIFQGKSVLVGGGTSGIGAAIAGAFSAAGAAVVITGRSEAEVLAARAAGLDARVLDVADNGAVETLTGSFARLDVLVNCAGMIRRQEEHEMEAFEQVLDVNLTGTMRLCAAARPLLARQGGAIVNTASMYSFFGAALAPAYSASKGGVVQLTKALAAAYA